MDKETGLLVLLGPNRSVFVFFTSMRITLLHFADTPKVYFLNPPKRLPIWKFDYETSFAYDKSASASKKLLELFPEYDILKHNK